MALATVPKPSALWTAASTALSPLCGGSAASSAFPCEPSGAAAVRVVVRGRRVCVTGEVEEEWASVAGPAQAQEGAARASWQEDGVWEAPAGP